MFGRKRVTLDDIVQNVRTFMDNQLIPQIPIPTLAADPVTAALNVVTVIGLVLLTPPGQQGMERFGRLLDRAESVLHKHEQPQANDQPHS